MMRQEQETTIRFDADKREVSIFTAYGPARRKIERRGYAPANVSRMNGIAVGWFYRIPYREFRWGVAGAGKGARPLTAEQREKLAERGRGVLRVSRARRNGSDQRESSTNLTVHAAQGAGR